MITIMLTKIEDTGQNDDDGFLQEAVLFCKQFLLLQVNKSKNATEFHVDEEMIMSNV